MSSEAPERIWLCREMMIGVVMEVSLRPEPDSVAEYIRRDVVEDMIDSACRAVHDVE